MKQEENKLLLLSLLFVPIFLFGLFVGLVGGYSYFYLYKSPINNTILDNQLLAQEEIIDLLYSQKAQLKNLEHNLKDDINSIELNPSFTIHNQQRHVFNNVLRSKQCDPNNFKRMKLMKVPHYTGSMRPLIYANDYILVVDYNPKVELVLGDIIANDIFIHRITRIDSQNNQLWTQGDNNQYEDGMTLISDVNFVVCGVLRGN